MYSIFAIAAFLSLAVLGAVADLIGIGNPHTFGVSQYLCMLIGIIGAYTSYLYLYKKLTSGQILNSLGNSYSMIGVNFLNLIVLIALVELGFTVALKIYLKTKLPTALRDSLSSPAYSKHEWISTFKKEYNSSQNFQYSPFFVWERMETKGETVNILKDGVRITKDSSCKGKKKIFMFGGSTMWGVGAPDWNTIPSELQQLLIQSGKTGYCVVNYGENAFVSTQNLLRLQKLIQTNDIPHLVIFYNGFNEIASGHQTKKAGMHQNFSEIAEKLNTGSNIRRRKEIRPIEILQYLMPNTYSYLFVYGRHQNFEELSFPKELPLQLAFQMNRDFEMVNALGEKFGFQSYFFLQPTLFEKKSWTSFENEVSKEVPKNFSDLLKETYIELRKVYSGNSSSLRMKDISATFENNKEEIFIDKVHLVPEANRKIAEEILKSIRL